jgi:hypothetical protein
MLLAPLTNISHGCVSTMRERHAREDVTPAPQARDFVNWLFRHIQFFLTKNRCDDVVHT